MDCGGYPFLTRAIKYVNTFNPFLNTLCHMRVSYMETNIRLTNNERRNSETEQGGTC